MSLSEIQNDVESFHEKLKESRENTLRYLKSIEEVFQSDDYGIFWLKQKKMRSKNSFSKASHSSTKSKKIMKEAIKTSQAQHKDLLPNVTKIGKTIDKIGEKEKIPAISQILPFAKVNTSMQEAMHLHFRLENQHELAKSLENYGNITDPEAVYTNETLESAEKVKFAIRQLVEHNELNKLFE